MIQVPTAPWTGSLSKEMVEAWNDVGAVRFTGFASPEEVARLRAALDDLGERWLAEGRRTVHGIPLKIGQRGDGRRFVQRFAFTSLFSPAFQEFVRSGRFEPVRRLMGEDFRVAEDEKDGVVVNHYRNELGSRYKALGWHTDGLRDLFYLRLPGPMINVGFYLDDSPIAKGALRILPGSHRQGFASMAFGKCYFVDHRPDANEVVVEAQAGDLTLHDGRLWHRVAEATVFGDASTRRTLYVPVIDGPVNRKHEGSPTPLYHRLQWVTG